MNGIRKAKRKYFDIKVRSSENFYDLHMIEAKQIFGFCYKASIVKFRNIWNK
jgi:hypothetical protein